MDTVGLIGGAEIAHYSIADLVWEQIFSIVGHKARFCFVPLLNQSSVKKFITHNLNYQSYKGCNVALPWKNIIVNIANQASEVAKKTGFANCVYSRKGKIMVDNTDGKGCLYTLHNDYSSIFILGIGGAGTVLSYEACMLGKQVYVYDPDDQAMTDFLRKSNQWSPQKKLITQVTMEGIEQLPNIDVIVNASPVGKLPHKELIIPVHASPISFTVLEKIAHHSVVVDMNYLPQKTEFLLQAEYLKNKIVPGVHMLIAQAIFSYQLFFNKKFPFSQISQLLSNITKKIYG